MAGQDDGADGDDGQDRSEESQRHQAFGDAHAAQSIAPSKQGTRPPRAHMAAPALVDDEPERR
jgi:hypothetical protein